jgi:hypothetical protein
MLTLQVEDAHVMARVDKDFGGHRRQVWLKANPPAASCSTRAGGADCVTLRLLPTIVFCLYGGGVTDEAWPLPDNRR